MSTIRGWIRSHSSLLRIVAMMLLAVDLADAAKVTAEALDAWDAQVHGAEAQLAKDLARPDHFLWLDREAGRIDAVRAGNVVAAHAAGSGMISVPSGLIHHWIGAVFIPDARALDALAALQDYDSYAGTFNPAVIDSKLLERGSNAFTYRLKFQQKGFGVKAGMLGEFRSRYFRVNPKAGYSITEATRVIELDHVGTAAERALTPDEARGYVERMFTIVRYRECEDGLYVETESLTLSRDIPAGMHWLVNPAIQHFSRSVITGTLDRLRERVEETRGIESAARR